MYRNIVVLTGAGISAESGIPVFRSESGLWEQEKIEDVCTVEALARDSLKVHNFYNKLRRNLADKLPNKAHLALTKLQQQWPQKFSGEVSIVTQNVDDLHEKALSQNVIHMHGKLMSIWCTHCQHHYFFDKDSSPTDMCKFCHEQALRPDIVFFGEMPYLRKITKVFLIYCHWNLRSSLSGCWILQVCKICGSSLFRGKFKQKCCSIRFY